MEQDTATVTCNVSGADNLNPMITYEWTKDNVTTTVRSETITLAPLLLSYAGVVYNCSVNVSSSFLDKVIHQTSKSEIMRIQSELINFMCIVHLHVYACSYKY